MYSFNEYIYLVVSGKRQRAGISLKVSLLYLMRTKCVNYVIYLINSVTHGPGIISIFVTVITHKSLAVKQRINFHIVQTWDNKTQFTGDDITITISGFTYEDDKHHMDEPATATAHFICCGKLYSAQNCNGFPTVEDWYFNELLPRFQMLSLLSSTDELTTQENNYTQSLLGGQN